MPDLTSAQRALLRLIESVFLGTLMLVWVERVGVARRVGELVDAANGLG